MVLHIHPAFVALCYGIQIAGNIGANTMFHGDSTKVFTYPWLQPAGLTFSVWGLIYASQAIFVVLQLVSKSVKEDPRVCSARPGICMTFLLNALWLIIQGAANHPEKNYPASYWMAAVDLVAYALFMKFGVYDQLTKENPVGDAVADSYWLEVKKHLPHKMLVLSPFSFTLAWTVVASNLNVCSNLLDLEKLKTFPTQIGGPDYAIGIAYGVALIAILFLFRHQDWAYAGVTAWALGGIIINQGNSASSNFPHEKSPSLVNAGTLCIVLIAVAGVVSQLLHFFDYRHRRAVFVKENIESSPSGQPQFDFVGMA